MNDPRAEAEKGLRLLEATAHIHTPEAIDRRLMATARKIHDLVPGAELRAALVDVKIWRGIAAGLTLTLFAIVILALVGGPS